MRYIIIGNGAAGMAAAEAIRDRDEAREIAIYTDEDRFHYSRPRIIEYLGGAIDADKLTIRSGDYYQRRRIILVKPAVVEAIDPLGRTISLRGGGTDSFDRLIIASGASSFLPSVEGADQDCVFTLRTIGDAEAILARCAGKKRAAIVGGGLLGIETAASLSRLGMTTTVVEMFNRLLPRQLDAEGGGILQSMLEAKGIRFLLGKVTAGISPAVSGVADNGDARDGAADNSAALRFDDGSSLEADIVVFSAGIRSNMELARKAGIVCDKGIVVDDYMETNIPGIYAAGDAAQSGGRVYGLWLPAKEQGSFAGRNATGDRAAYPGSVVSSTLKVSGVELASIGAIEAGEGVAVTTRLGAEGYRRLFVKDGRLAGAILLGEVSASRRLQKLLASGEIIADPAALLG
jgi:nitrite reductase (NADH) large subunit